MGMSVDFNNLRMQAAVCLDSVIKTLNKGKMPSSAYSSQDMPDGKTKQFEGDVLVSADDLQKDIDHLRNCVWTLLCLYEDGNEACKSLWEEVEAEGGIARFNEEEES
jgi:hypothetical protein